jgi:hypothetical protein
VKLAPLWSWSRIDPREPAMALSLGDFGQFLQSPP